MKTINKLIYTLATCIGIMFIYLYNAPQAPQEAFNAFGLMIVAWIYLIIHAIIAEAIHEYHDTAKIEARINKYIRH